MNLFEDCNNDADIKQKFKTLAKIYHPDNGGTTAQMQEVNRQYRIAINKLIDKNPSIEKDITDNYSSHNNRVYTYQDIADIMNEGKNSNKDFKIPFYLYPFYLFFFLSPRIFLIVLPSIFILIYFFSDFIAEHLREFVYHILKIR